LNIDLNLTVNQKRYQIPEYPGETLLIDFLGEELGLTGTKFCCGIAVCRACTVVLHSAPKAAPIPILACSTPVSQVNGQSVTTVEGLAGPSGTLTPLQQAFLDEFAFQCGYCTPGFLMAAHAMVERLRASPVSPSQVDQVILESCGQHICRCTGYVCYLRAIRKVVLNTPGLQRP
jgi:aerobic-type carbon monoxide dehydrogenase small subunit (CoxS/CutS family)